MSSSSTMRSASARLAIGSLLVGGVLLGGCPREIQPPPPGDRDPCVTHADCNGGADCGLLRLCVDQACEEQPSLRVPCGR